jgi:hypothetical protein
VTGRPGAGCRAMASPAADLFALDTLGKFHAHGHALCDRSRSCRRYFAVCLCARSVAQAAAADRRRPHHGAVDGRNIRGSPRYHHGSLTRIETRPDEVPRQQTEGGARDRILYACRLRTASGALAWFDGWWRRQTCKPPYRKPRYGLSGNHRSLCQPLAREAASRRAARACSSVEIAQNAGRARRAAARPFRRARAKRVDEFVPATADLDRFNSMRFLDDFAADLQRFRIDFWTSPRLLPRSWRSAAESARFDVGKPLCSMASLRSIKF